MASVSAKDIHNMKITLPILVLMAVCCAAHASERVKGIIGDTDLSFRARTIQKGRSLQLPIDLQEAKLIRIREVYPDTPKQPRYTYDVLIDGKLVFRRDCQGTGFGAVSFFIRVPEWARESGQITIMNRGADLVRMMCAQPVTAESLNKIESTDSFGLLGMAPWSHGSKQAKAWIDHLASEIPVKPGFYRGYSTEFYFARWTKADVEQQIVDSLKWAKEKDMAFLLITHLPRGVIPDLESRKVTWDIQRFIEGQARVSLTSSFDTSACGRTLRIGRFLVIHHVTK